MYPLMEPALNDLASQICTKQSLEDITYSDDNKYTSQVLLDAITSALGKAEKNPGSSTKEKSQKSNTTLETIEESTAAPPAENAAENTTVNSTEGSGENTAENTNMETPADTPEETAAAAE